MDIPQGDAKYDAATANMSSLHKMPTLTQCRELINGATSEWTTLNGINGRKFFSNIDSTIYIFLPAGGMWVNTSYSQPGERGFWWTSTVTHYPDSSIPTHYAYYFNIDDQSPSSSNQPFYMGFSVRAIN